MRLKQTPRRWTPEEADRTTVNSVTFILIFTCILGFCAALFRTWLGNPLLSGLILVTIGMGLGLVTQLPRYGLRWSLGPDGISTRTGLPFVASQLGLIAVSCGLAIVFFHVAVAYRHYSYAVGGVAIICVIILQLYEMRGLHANDARFEVELTPKQVRLRSIDGRLYDFDWEKHPQLTGLDVQNLHIRTSGSALHFIRRTLIPLRATELRDILDYYSSHPDHRAELATEAGLIRFLDFCKNPG